MTAVHRFAAMVLALAAVEGRAEITPESLDAAARAVELSYLPKGEIILPGLDVYLSTDAWNTIDEGHPQATLKALLEILKCDRQDIQCVKAELSLPVEEGKKSN